jgi:penicillin amidase
MPSGSKHRFVVSAGLFKFQETSPSMLRLKKLRHLIAALLISGIIHTDVTAQQQQVAVPGLQSTVEVLRDQWGINHIYAANQHDLFFTQGYCAARDRLFQFEIWRRQATGTVAEILGPQELKRDIGTRLFLFRGDMKKELNHYHPEGEAIINAYVSGINAYIDEVLRNPEQLPVEFRLLNIKPGKWTPEVVISRHQGLLGNVGEELSLGRAVAKAGPDKVKDLMWFHPQQPNLTLDPSITEALLSKNILELYDASHRPVTFRRDISNATSFHQSRVPFEHDPEGSNNWIISGSKTESGFPFLANDPHRSIALPSLRYMVHLVAPGWNVIGAGEPVIPGISIGHNEHGAWGLTIFATDGEDLYVYDLNPQNLAQYKYRNKWVDMKEINETIAVKDSASVNVTLRYTVHGPVTFIDSTNKKAYAIKCAWLEPGGAPYLASLRMNQAENWKQFREASKYSHIPGENMVWADRKGNIGWQVVGINPIRKNFSGMVPVPGDGRFEWKGYQNIKNRPNIYNPKKGFFATANQHVTPGDYRHGYTIGYTWADPFRGDRINEVWRKTIPSRWRKPGRFKPITFPFPHEPSCPCSAK